MPWKTFSTVDSTLAVASEVLILLLLCTFCIQKKDLTEACANQREWGLDKLRGEGNALQVENKVKEARAGS